MSDDTPNQQLLVLQIVTVLSLIILFVWLGHLVALTKVEIGGVRKLNPEYFETYNQCGEQP